METIDLLLTRRSCVVGAMTEPGPTDLELDQILRAGLRVPDHGRLWPWRIQVVDKSAQTQLGNVCASRFTSLHLDATPEAVETERRRPSRAPLLLVVTSRIEPEAHIPVIEQQLSGGALCQNLLNGAHALGYVAQWLTEWPVYDQGVSEALGHAPTDTMIAWIHIGSTSEPPAERPRATVNDVVTHWDGTNN